MAKSNQIVVQTTKALTKKGKLKGKNKKETKMLKAACPHHVINKKGSIKNKIWVNDGDYCVCTLCNAKFPASFYKDPEIDEIVDSMIELNNQNKFTATATNAGDDTIKLLAQEGVILSKYKKLSKKVKGLAEKQNKVKNKNKKNHSSGSSMYGSWGSHR